MGVLDGILGRFGYIRYANGNHFYFNRSTSTSFIGGVDKLKIAKENPVLSTCIEIRAKVLSLADFYIENDNGERVDHEIIDLINNPNAHQSKQDFLKQYEWFKCAYGWVYQRPFGAIGFTPEAIFNLKPSNVKFNGALLNPIVYSKKDVDQFYEQKFTYVTQAKTANYELGSIIPFYDITNGLSDENESAVKGESRIDSIIKQISNIAISADAENIMLQTNGREIFSGGASKGSELGSSMPLGQDDKKNIEEKFINSYGLGLGKKRSIATQKDVLWKSLHIPLKELGLHESIENNAGLVRSVYEIPNELYAAHVKGATYENQKEALIGFIQNSIQTEADDLANSWTTYFGLQDTPIKASFKHLPVMQHTENKKADKILKIAMAYEKLTKAGLNEEAIHELFESQGININNEEQ